MKKCLFKKKKNKKGERKGLKNQAVDMTALNIEESDKLLEKDNGGKEEEEKEEVNLGKLQFSLDYDFQQNNVSLILNNSTVKNVKRIKF